LTQRRAGHLHVLRSGADFESVLRSGLRLASPNFVLRARANAVGIPRLGIIAGRRAASRAVDRNRGKRLIREAFRSARAAIGAYDVTIQLRTDLRKDLSSAVRSELCGLLDALVRRSGSRPPVTPNGQ
jgi:ribonuclease P protein component